MTISRRAFFRRIALYVSPLCFVPHLVGYLLTAEKYRSPEWFIAIICVVPIMFFSASLIGVSSSKRLGWFGLLMLLLSFSVWLLSIALGLFTILVSDDPGWFH